MKEKKTERIRGYYENLPDGGPARPAVTHIIGEVWAKKQLRYWYGAVGNSEARRISQESMSFGSAMHKIVAEYLRGQVPAQETMAEEIKQAWELWLELYENRFAEDYPMGPGGEKIEEIIWNEDFAGTCDWFSRSTLFDWKFGGGIYDSYKLQMGAYSHILDAKKAYIVRIDKSEKNTEVLEMDSKDLEEAYGAFEHCLGLFKWKERQ